MNPQIGPGSGGNSGPVATPTVQTPAQPAPSALHKQLKIGLSDKNSIVFDDTAGTITFQCASGAKITLGSSGITVDDGSGAKIELSGGNVKINGTQVDMNSGALTVT